MRRSRFRPPRKLAPSLDQQAARIRARFVGFQTKIGGGQLVATGMLQPTEMSARYRVRLRYTRLHPPSVYVLSPELVPNAAGEPPPHRYPEPGDPLCLYYPKNREWTADDWIAATTIPWTCEYLLFYEFWHATGVWHGGGVDHGAAKVGDE